MADDQGNIDNDSAQGSPAPPAAASRRGSAGSPTSSDSPFAGLTRSLQRHATAGDHERASMSQLLARYPSGAPVISTDELLQSVISAQPHPAVALPANYPASPQGSRADLQQGNTLSPALEAAGQSWRREKCVKGDRPSDVESAAYIDAASQASKREKFVWKGPSLLKVAAIMAVGFGIRFLPIKPLLLTDEAWSLFAIFIATIFALILEPLPTGAIAIIAATITIVTKTLPFRSAFAGFSNPTIWLIVASFLFAKGFSSTGLGSRLAVFFVSIFGYSSLQLSTALTYAGLLLCPAIPSTSARTSGIFLPVCLSITEGANSYPGPTASRLGKYIMMVQIQSSGPTTALFLSGAAPNILCLELAASLGVIVPNPWIFWFVAAFLPSAICVMICPYVVYKMIVPELKDTPEAVTQAKEQLQESGPMSWDEIILALTMILCITLWILSGVLQLPAPFTALIALAILLFTGVLKWKECVGYTPAWDTFIWFSILVTMSTQLTETGVTQYFTEQISSMISAFTTNWLVTFYTLHLFYFLMHYLIASQTAHAAALYAPFLSLMIAGGVPPLLGALTLAFSNNLFGGITTFSSAQSSIYYGTGYLSLKEVFSMGAFMALINYTVFGTIGMLWWKAVGVY